MYVVATAGHVDHGKSTLVRALTGMEPDRWAEERRRGMTIDLGYAWMTLPPVSGRPGEKLAFVDVPGHERFVPNMLAGLGPVPAVMFIVAADGGWMPQSAEHLAAVNALGVRHGLLVITRSDLADPGPATRQALAEIARTSLGAVEAVPVSAVTGQGLDTLKQALLRLVQSLNTDPDPSPPNPAPSQTAPTRTPADPSEPARPTTEQGKAHQAAAGPGAPANAKTDQGDAERTDSAHGKTEQGKAGRTDAGPGDYAHGRTERGDARRAEAGRGDAGRTEARPSDSARGRTERGEAGRTATGRGNTGRGEISGADAPDISPISTYGRRDSPVRLWIDRSFTIRGAGTVVTGTLPAGTVANGQELQLAPTGRTVRVRGLEALGEPAETVTGVARVALNLRGIPADLPTRGMALIQPGRWTLTTEIDVRITPPASAPHPKFPPDLLLHIGSARTRARVRLLGTDPVAPNPANPNPANPNPANPNPVGTGPAATDRVGSAPLGTGSAAAGQAIDPADDESAGARPAAIYARLRLTDPLPLHAGDRVILRDPGAATLAIYGARVLDPFPPPLARRGAGAAAVRELCAWPDTPRPEDLLGRHKLLRASQLTAAGLGALPAPVAGEWLADPAHWAWLRAELPKVVAAFAAKDPLAPGMPAEAARAALSLPSRELVSALAGEDVVLDGAYLRIFAKHAADQETEQEGAATGGKAAATKAIGQLPPRIAEGVQAVLDGLASDPFAAPDTERLRALGLDARALAAAARVGALLRIADLVVLTPGADKEAARILAGLEQPFTTSQARQALRTSRRVAIPLLEHLDRTRVTERLPGDLRRLRP